MKKTVDIKSITKKAKPLLWAIVVLFFLGATHTAIQNRKDSRATGIAFDIKSLGNGKSLITESDILASIERSFGYPLKGLALRELDVERVERVLEADPLISTADVYVDAQSKIHIEVQQREPLLRVMDKHGANYYLDADGVKMPLSKHFTARVLVATGNIPPYTPDFLTTKNKGLLKDIYELSNHILNDDFLHHQIEQLYVNSLGEVTLIPKVGNQKIYLGLCADYTQKLENLKTFYKEGIPYIGWHKYDGIDLRFKGQVIGKKKSHRKITTLNNV